MSDLKWLDAYSGQTVDQLLSFEGEYRLDSLVLAFEDALLQKIEREGPDTLSPEERIILAIEALEREVNNGGYSSFFTNSSQEFAPIIVNALVRIGCPKTVEISQTAIDSLDLPSLSVEAIDAAMSAQDHEDELNECDDSYYKAGEDIAGRLFAFIKLNRSAIAL
jgi:hypothetical protein